MENKPAKKFRAGTISATVWKNTVVRDGKEVEFPTVSLQRSYKDKEGQWQQSNNLRRDDLPKAMLVLEEAYKELSLAE